MVKYMDKKKSNIIIIGVKHSGKSTIGKILTEKEGKLFIDLDEMLEKLYESSKKYTSREIYNNIGPDNFSKLEIEALKKIFLLCKDNDIVLSLGGGTIENMDAIKLLEGFGSYVYLEVKKPDVLFDRIIKNGQPSFLVADDIWENFKIIFDRRSEKCRELADIVINPIDGDPHYSALKIYNKLKELNYGR